MRVFELRLKLCHLRNAVCRAIPSEWSQYTTAAVHPCADQQAFPDPRISCDDGRSLAGYTASTIGRSKVHGTKR